VLKLVAVSRQAGSADGLNHNSIFCSISLSVSSRMR
jgi:hypothetical protein